MAVMKGGVIGMKRGAMVESIGEEMEEKDIMDMIRLGDWMARVILGATSSSKGGGV